MCGVSSASTLNVTNVQQDINQGLRLLKNQTRRAWTRKEVTTSLIEGQQYYTFAEDIIRGTEVRTNTTGLSIPVIQVDSEAKWNNLNVVPAFTINIPFRYFIRGNNEIGMWPVPSETTANGLIVSYESRTPDMSLADTLNLSIAVINGENTITNAAGLFTANMVGQRFSVTDGSDGNWYLITAYTDDTTMTLENYYQGPTETATSTIIGQCPDIPEDYHLALAYFAAYNYYLKRKDMEQAQAYQGMYNALIQEYKETYAAKTTGQVQDDDDMGQWNSFWLPPTNITN